MPVSIEQDASLRTPCLDICSNKKQHIRSLQMSDKDCEFKDMDPSSGSLSLSSSSPSSTSTPSTTSSLSHSSSDGKNKGNDDGDLALKIELDILKQACYDRNIPVDDVRSSIGRLEGE